MLIYFTAEDPHLAASFVTWNPHKSKLFLEAVQMLFWAHRIRGTADLPAGAYNATPSQIANPYTQWTAASVGNYRWLLAYAHALNDIYEQFNRSRYLEDQLNRVPPSRATQLKKHKSAAHLPWLSAHLPACPVEERQPLPILINEKLLPFFEVYNENGERDVCLTYRRYVADAQLRSERRRVEKKASGKTVAPRGVATKRRVPSAARVRPVAIKA